MLEKEFWGNTVEDWGISLLIIAGAYLVMKLVSFLSRTFILPITRKTKFKLDNVIYHSVVSPLLFAILLVGFWVAIHHLVLPGNFVGIVDNTYTILIVLNITWLFVRLTSSLIETYWMTASTHRMLPIVKRTFVVVVWSIGGIMALSNVGINISALLGTLGIGGIAFALAAQDTVKNIFGAFTILTDKPFGIGDTVIIDRFEGTIIDVGIRSTKIQGYDKRIVALPNYKVADASVVNISSEDPYRRVVMKIGLTYDTSSERMEEAIRLLNEISSRLEFVKKDNVSVYFSEFADSALVITFIYFLDKRGGIPQVTSRVNMEILRTFNQAGLSFAYPTQTLYIEHSKGDS
jgi:MscS family membrane protein